MTIYTLINMIHAHGVDFSYPPSKTIASRWVRVDGKKVGVYNSMKTDKGEGLHFRFETPEMALIMRVVLEGIGSEVYLNEKLKAIITYPKDEVAPGNRVATHYSEVDEDPAQYYY